MIFTMVFIFKTNLKRIIPPPIIQISFKKLHGIQRDYPYPM